MWEVYQTLKATRVRGLFLGHLCTSGDQPDLQKVYTNVFENLPWPGPVVMCTGIRLLQKDSITTAVDEECIGEINFGL